MTDDEFDWLKTKVENNERLLQSLAIAHVGIEDLNEHQIEIVGKATQHIKNRADYFRRKRYDDKKKSEIENQIEVLKHELEQYR